MANIVTQTENFNHADWTQFSSLIVTTNTHAAPAFAGINATLADTLEDATGAAQSGMQSTFRTISNDSSDWVTSAFVRKDATTSRFPELLCQFANGTGIVAGISYNTSTGEIANATAGAPDASGVDDIDATWWRFWFRKANNGTGNTSLRTLCFPARATTLGGGNNSAAVGLIVLWGVNQTNTSTVQTYEPDPFYAFTRPRLLFRV
jgi:hypothetical protein